MKINRLARVIMSLAIASSLTLGLLPKSDDTVMADTTEVQIGDESGSDYYSPSYTFFNYSVTQQIYTASDLGNLSGTIEYISFNMASETSISRNIDLYLMDTDKTGFTSKTDWLSFT